MVMFLEKICRGYTDSESPPPPEWGYRTELFMKIHEKLM